MEMPGRLVVAVFLLEFRSSPLGCIRGIRRAAVDTPSKHITRTSACVADRRMSICQKLTSLLLQSFNRKPPCQAQNVKLPLKNCSKGHGEHNLDKQQTILVSEDGPTAGELADGRLRDTVDFRSAILRDFE